MKYEYKKGKFIKNGHTMFEEDVLTDLKRLAFLEKERNKQLNLGVVSHRRELLLDFWMSLPKTHKHKGIAENYIDNYLKSNNCG